MTPFSRRGALYAALLASKTTHAEAIAEGEVQARRGDVHQALHAIGLAGLEHLLGGRHVGIRERLDRAPGR